MTDFIAITLVLVALGYVLNKVWDDFNAYGYMLGIVIGLIIQII